MAVHFIDISREEFFIEYKRIYRFITLDRLIDVLKSNRFAFVNPSIWTDPFEKFFLEREFIIDDQHYYLPAKDKVFALCVSGTLNSEAFWKVYAPKEDGVRLTFNAEKLVTNFLDQLMDADVYIGKVNYQITRQFYSLTIDKEKLKSEILSKKVGENQLRLFMKKRKSFLYEDEIRILVVPHKKSRPAPVFMADCDLLTFTSEFNLDPRMGKNHVDVWKKFFLQEFNLKVSHSQLYAGLKTKPFNLSK
ncbi:MAG TPA: DUF2971 domain-containing protein [Flavobacteriales bacterium]|jgi:hypothetical protein|nr:DUF2971 domain-containing protein [Flavobacteriales bacterium]